METAPFPALGRAGSVGAGKSLQGLPAFPSAPSAACRAGAVGEGGSPRGTPAAIVSMPPSETSASAPDCVEADEAVPHSGQNFASPGNVFPHFEQVIQPPMFTCRHHSPPPRAVTSSFGPPSLPFQAPVPQPPLEGERPREPHHVRCRADLFNPVVIAASVIYGVFCVGVLKGGRAPDADSQVWIALSIASAWISFGGLYGLLRIRIGHYGRPHQLAVVAGGVMLLVLMSFRRGRVCQDPILDARGEVMQVHDLGDLCQGYVSPSGRSVPFFNFGIWLQHLYSLRYWSLCVILLSTGT